MKIRRFLCTLTLILVTMIGWTAEVAPVAHLAGPDREVFQAAITNPVPSYDFATPIFGLAIAPDGSLLVADAGAGVVELRQGEGHLIAGLPGVTDIAPIGRGEMFAVTGGGPGETAAKLFRVSRGRLQEVADLGAFEASVNPDGGRSIRTRSTWRRCLAGRPSSPTPAATAC